MIIIYHVLATLGSSVSPTIMFRVTHVRLLTTTTLVVIMVWYLNGAKPLLNQHWHDVNLTMKEKVSQVDYVITVCPWDNHHGHMKYSQWLLFLFNIGTHFSVICIQIQQFVLQENVFENVFNKMAASVSTIEEPTLPIYGIYAIMDLIITVSAGVPTRGRQVLC